MITKKGIPKCDRCGRFVSWFDIGTGTAIGKYWEHFVLTLGGYEGPIEEYDVECPNCVSNLTTLR